MKRSIVILVVITGVLIARATAHPAPVRVTFRAETQVQTAERFKVKDIASIEAPDELARKLGDIVAGGRLTPGSRRTIDTRCIKLKLNAAAAGKEIVVEGPSRITVVGKCVKISSQQLADEATKFVLSQLPQDSRTYEVVVRRLPRELVLPDHDNVEIKPRMLSRSVRPGPGTVAIDALFNGRRIATTSAGLQINAVADVLVATATIHQGETLSAQNTAWEQRDVTGIAEAIVMGPGGEMQDWVARRTLSAGRAITPTDVALPPTIRRGETVTLMVRCGKVTLRTTAEAKQDGRTGETVPVRSSVSRNDVRARIVAPGLVEINR